MKSHKRLNKGVLIFFIFLIFLAGCHFFVDPSFRQQYTDYNSFVHSNPEEPGYLKVHYKDGQVVVYNTWDLSEEKDSLTGEGKLFDLRREMIMEGPLATAMDQVAIIETNQLEALKDKTKSRVAGLSILAGIDAVIGVVCIAMPKACFGSCPTFYLDETENLHYANAEAFSSSMTSSKTGWIRPTWTGL